MCATTTGSYYYHYCCYHCCYYSCCFYYNYWHWHWYPQHYSCYDCCHFPTITVLLLLLVLVLILLLKLLLYIMILSLVLQLAQLYLWYYYAWYTVYMISLRLIHCIYDIITPDTLYLWYYYAWYRYYCQYKHCQYNNYCFRCNFTAPANAHTYRYIPTQLLLLLWLAMLPHIISIIKDLLTLKAYLWLLNRQSIFCL